jgi:hypothetical protein
MSISRRTVSHCDGRRDANAESIEHRTSDLSAFLGPVAGASGVQPSVPNANRPSASARKWAVWKPPVIRDLGGSE